MRWTGIIVLLFIVWHLLDLTGRHGQPRTSSAATMYRNVDASLSRVPGRGRSTSSPTSRSASTSYHGTWSLFQSMGWANPRFNRVAPLPRHRLRHRRSSSATSRSRSPCSPASSRSDRGRRSRMTSDTARPRPSRRTPKLHSKSPDGPVAEMWDDVQERREVGQPQQQAQVQDHRGRHRPGRRVGRGHAGRARLPGRRVHVPRLAAPSALDRRAGRHQRRQELPAATATRSIACSTTRSRAATSAPASRTCTAWREVSVDIIDQMVAQGVPFAREYGGLLDNRSFGGAQVSRTFYARGQTGQQLLLGAYQQMARQIGLGNVRLFNRVELVDTVVIDGRCAGIVTRDLINGEVQSHVGARRRAVHRRLRQRVLPVDQRDELQRHRGVARAPPGRVLRQPVLHADPPDVHPAGRRHAVEADVDVRVAAQRRPGVGAEEPRRRAARADQIPEDERDYFLERLYPELRQPRPARHLVARGQARGRQRPRRRPVEERRHTSTSPMPSPGSARTSWRSATATCSRCTSASPARTRTPCRCASTRPATTRWAGCGSTTS